MRLEKSQRLKSIVALPYSSFKERISLLNKAPKGSRRWFDDQCIYYEATDFQV